MSNAEKSRSKLKELEAAEALSVQPCTMKAWRRHGRGPAFMRLGRAVRYDRDDIEAFERERRVVPAGDRG